MRKISRLLWKLRFRLLRRKLRAIRRARLLWSILESA